MERLFEMANYYKEDLELPVNIWLDENETYKFGKHEKRIKFQINYMDKIREEYMCQRKLLNFITFIFLNKIIQNV